MPCPGAAAGPGGILPAPPEPVPRRQPHLGQICDTSLSYQVDLLKKKYVLLELVTELTEGIVNGKKLEVRSPFKHNLSSSAKTVLKITQASLPENRAHESPCLQEAVTAQEGSSLDSSSDTRASESGLVTEAQGPKPHECRDLKDRKGWPRFQEIFMLAALTGEEVDTLKVTSVGIAVRL